MLELRNVDKFYETKKSTVVALKDVNVSFASHGLYFILGKSGSGKSTLLNIIAGIDDFNVYRFTIFTIISLLIISFVSCIISTLIPIIKISYEPPIRVISN
ncbi:MAG: ATP-binding cassette domain-containing protein [Anaeroplasmataceae bacterium]|nr:ATP-binding cassette domain-containing protein [Anaeroplasmataceae bacterium]